MNKSYRQQALVAFISGLIFAFGLAISGMTQPQKVIGFLQLGSGWDPSLIFVMIGAIFIHGISYRWIVGRPSPLLDHRWHIPRSKEINWSLAIGAALFGLGWGLGGFCPGPALVSFAAGQSKALYFVVAMLAGMGLQRLYLRFFSKR